MAFMGRAWETKKISLLTGGIRFLRRVFPSPFVLDGEEVTPELDSPEEEIWGERYFYSDYKNKEPRKPQSNHPKVLIPVCKKNPCSYTEFLINNEI